MLFERWFKKGYSYANTRRYIRLPAKWPVKCLLAGEPLISETQDVSAGGILVQMPQQAPIGTSLQVELHIPEIKRSLPAQGKITRCDSIKRGTQFIWGIEFTQMEPNDRAELDKVIKRFFSSRERDNQGSGYWWRKIG